MESEESIIERGIPLIFCERRQARWLCEGANAEKTWGDRPNTAGKQWSVVPTFRDEVQRNEAVLWM